MRKTRKGNAGVVVVVVVAILIAVVFAVMPELRCKVFPSKAAEGMKDATELSLELVYTGEKPSGVGSVQSFAIVDDYFVVAGRPRGTAAEGGETNNQLMIISRSKKQDVTADFIPSGTKYELGHANGMTYNGKEIVVVGIASGDGYDMMAKINAKDFSYIGSEKMPCYGTGVAYNSRLHYYVIRSGDSLFYVNDLPGIKKGEMSLETDFARQDIGFSGGYTYLCNWVNSDSKNRADELGLEVNQNVIYKVDSSGVIANVYVIKSPKNELEGIDFDGGEAYLLVNGIGDDSGKFFIYKTTLK